MRRKAAERSLTDTSDESFSRTNQYGSSASTKEDFKKAIQKAKAAEERLRNRAAQQVEQSQRKHERLERRFVEALHRLSQPQKPYAEKAARERERGRAVERTLRGTGSSLPPPKPIYNTSRSPSPAKQKALQRESSPGRLRRSTGSLQSRPNAPQVRFLRQVESPKLDESSEDYTFLKDGAPISPIPIRRQSSPSPTLTRVQHSPSPPKSRGRSSSLSLGPTARNLNSTTGRLLRASVDSPRALRRKEMDSAGTARLRQRRNQGRSPSRPHRSPPRPPIPQYDPVIQSSSNESPQDGDSNRESLLGMAQARSGVREVLSHQATARDLEAEIQGWQDRHRTAKLREGALVAERDRLEIDLNDQREEIIALQNKIALLDLALGLIGEIPNCQSTQNMTELLRHKLSVILKAETVRILLPEDLERFDQSSTKTYTREDRAILHVRSSQRTLNFGSETAQLDTSFEVSSFPTQGASGIGSLLTVPVLSPDPASDTIAVFQVCNKRGRGGFTTEDEVLTRTIAVHVGMLLSLFDAKERGDVVLKEKNTAQIENSQKQTVMKSVLELTECDTYEELERTITVSLAETFSATSARLLCVESPSFKSVEYEDWGSLESMQVGSGICWIEEGDSNQLNACRRILGGSTLRQFALLVIKDPFIPRNAPYGVILFGFADTAEEQQPHPLPDKQAVNAVVRVIQRAIERCREQIRKSLQIEIETLMMSLKELSSVPKIQRAISQGAFTDSVLGIDAAQLFLDFSQIQSSQRNQSGTVLPLSSSYSLQDQEGNEVFVDQGVLYQAIALKKVVQAEQYELANLSRFFQIPSMVPKSAIAIPLLSRSKCLGVVLLLSRRDAYFVDSHMLELEDCRFGYQLGTVLATVSENERNINDQIQITERLYHVERSLPLFCSMMKVQTNRQKKRRMWAHWKAVALSIQCTESSYSCEQMQSQVKEITTQHEKALQRFEQIVEDTSTSNKEFLRRFVDCFHVLSEMSGKLIHRNEVWEISKRACSVAFPWAQDVAILFSESGAEEQSLRPSGFPTYILGKGVSGSLARSQDMSGTAQVFEGISEDEGVRGASCVDYPANLLCCHLSFEDLSGSKVVFRVAGGQDTSFSDFDKSLLNAIVEVTQTSILRILPLKLLPAQSNSSLVDKEFKTSLVQINEAAFKSPRGDLQALAAVTAQALSRLTRATEVKVSFPDGSKGVAASDKGEYGAEQKMGKTHSGSFSSTRNYKASGLGQSNADKFYIPFVYKKTGLSEDNELGSIFLQGSELGGFGAFEQLIALKVASYIEALSELLKEVESKEHTWSAVYDNFEEVKDQRMMLEQSCQEYENFINLMLKLLSTESVTDIVDHSMRSLPSILGFEEAQYIHGNQQDPPEFVLSSVMSLGPTKWPHDLPVEERDGEWLVRYQSLVGLMRRQSQTKVELVECLGEIKGALICWNAHGNTTATKTSTEHWTSTFLSLVARTIGYIVTSFEFNELVTSHHNMREKAEILNARLEEETERYRQLETECSNVRSALSGQQQTCDLVQVEKEHLNQQYSKLLQNISNEVLDCSQALEDEQVLEALKSDKKAVAEANGKLKVFSSKLLMQCKFTEMLFPLCNCMDIEVLIESVEQSVQHVLNAASVMLVVKDHTKDPVPTPALTVFSTLEPVTKTVQAHGGVAIPVSICWPCITSEGKALGALFVEWGEGDEDSQEMADRIYSEYTPFVAEAISRCLQTKSVQEEAGQLPKLNSAVRVLASASRLWNATGSLSSLGSCFSKLTPVVLGGGDSEISPTDLDATLYLVETDGRLLCLQSGDRLFHTDHADANYAAASKQIVRKNDVLCIPLLQPNGDCTGVACIKGRNRVVHFSDLDTEVAQLWSSLLGPVVCFVQNLERAQEKAYDDDTAISELQRQLDNIQKDLEKETTDKARHAMLLKALYSSVQVTSSKASDAEIPGFFKTINGILDAVAVGARASAILVASDIVPEMKDPSGSAEYPQENEAYLWTYFGTMSGHPLPQKHVIQLERAQAEARVLKMGEMICLPTERFSSPWHSWFWSQVQDCKSILLLPVTTVDEDVGGVLAIGWADDLAGGIPAGLKRDLDIVAHHLSLLLSLHQLNVWLQNAKGKYRGVRNDLLLLRDAAENEHEIYELLIQGIAKAQSFCQCQTPYQLGEAVGNAVAKLLDGQTGSFWFQDPKDKVSVSALSQGYPKVFTSPVDISKVIKIWQVGEESHFEGLFCHETDDDSQVIGKLEVSGFSKKLESSHYQVVASICTLATYFLEPVSARMILQDEVQAYIDKLQHSMSHQETHQIATTDQISALKKEIESFQKMFEYIPSVLKEYAIEINWDVKALVPRIAYQFSAMLISKATELASCQDVRVFFSTPSSEGSNTQLIEAVLESEGRSEFSFEYATSEFSAGIAVVATGEYFCKEETHFNRLSSNDDFQRQPMISLYIPLLFPRIISGSQSSHALGVMFLGRVGSKAFSEQEIQHIEMLLQVATYSLVSSFEMHQKQDHFRASENFHNMRLMASLFEHFFQVRERRSIQCCFNRWSSLTRTARNVAQKGLIDGFRVDIAEKDKMESSLSRHLKFVASVMGSTQSNLVSLATTIENSLAELFPPFLDSSNRYEGCNLLLLDSEQHCLWIPQDESATSSTTGQMVEDSDRILFHIGSMTPGNKYCSLFSHFVLILLTDPMTDQMLGCLRCRFSQAPSPEIVNGLLPCIPQILSSLVAESISFSSHQQHLNSLKEDSLALQHDLYIQIQKMQFLAKVIQCFSCLIRLTKSTNRPENYNPTAALERNVESCMQDAGLQSIDIFLVDGAGESESKLLKDIVHGSDLVDRGDAVQVTRPVMNAGLDEGVLGSIKFDIAKPIEQLDQCSELFSLLADLLSAHVVQWKSAQELESRFVDSVKLMKALEEKADEHEGNVQNLMALSASQSVQIIIAEFLGHLVSIEEGFIGLGMLVAEYIPRIVQGCKRATLHIIREDQDGTLHFWNPCQDSEVLQPQMVACLRQCAVSRQRSATRILSKPDDPYSSDFNPFVCYPVYRNGSGDVDGALEMEMEDEEFPDEAVVLPSLCGYIATVLANIKHQDDKDVKVQGLENRISSQTRLLDLLEHLRSAEPFTLDYACQAVHDQLPDTFPSIISGALLYLVEHQNQDMRDASFITYRHGSRKELPSTGGFAWHLASSGQEVWFSSMNALPSYSAISDLPNLESAVFSGVPVVWSNPTEDSIWPIAGVLEVMGKMPSSHAEQLYVQGILRKVCSQLSYLMKVHGLQKKIEEKNVKADEQLAEVSDIVKDLKAQISSIEIERQMEYQRMDSANQAVQAILDKMRALYEEVFPLFATCIGSLEGLVRAVGQCGSILQTASQFTLFIAVPDDSSLWTLDPSLPSGSRIKIKANSLNKGRVHLCAATGQKQVVTDLQQDPLVDHEVDLLCAGNPESLLDPSGVIICSPILISEGTTKVLGVLRVICESSLQGEIELVLEPIAALLCIIIQSSMLKDQYLQKEVEGEKTPDITKLKSKIIEARNLAKKVVESCSSACRRTKGFADRSIINDENEPDSSTALLKRATSSGRKLLNASNVNIFIILSERGLLRVYSSSFQDEYRSDTVESTVVEWRPGLGLLGTVVQEVETMNLRDVTEDVRYDPRVDGNHAPGTMMLLLPLVDSQGEVQGVFQATSNNNQKRPGKKGRNFTVEQVLQAEIFVNCLSCLLQWALALDDRGAVGRNL